MKGLKKANNTLQEFFDLVESKQVSSHNQKNLARRHRPWYIIYCPIRSKR